MQNEIITVLGLIAPEELGFTDMHAHIMTDMSIWRRLAEPLMPDESSVSGDEPVSLENVGLLRRNWFSLAQDPTLFLAVSAVLIHLFFVLSPVLGPC